MAINAATLTANIQVTGAQQAARDVQAFGDAVRKTGDSSSQAAPGVNQFDDAAKKTGQDAGNAAPAVDKLGKATKDAGDSAQQSHGHLSNLQSTLADVAKTAAGFTLGSAIQEAPKKLLEFAQAAAEDEQSTLRVQQALKNAGASTAEYTTRLDEVIKKGQELAFSDDETRDAVSKLVTQTGSAEEAYQRLAVAQDLARGANIPLETASKLLGKTTDENTQILKRLGVSLHDVTSASEVFQAVESKFGGQAATYADSAAGKYAKLKDSLAEIGESVGYLVLPVLSAISGTAVQVVEKIQGIMAAFSSSAPAQALGILAKIPQPIQDAAKAAGIAVIAITALGVAYGAVTTAIEAFNLAALATNPILLAGTALIAGAVFVYEQFAGSSHKAAQGQQDFNKHVQDLLNLGVPLSVQMTDGMQRVQDTAQAYEDAQRSLTEYKQANAGLIGFSRDATQGLYAHQQAVEDTKRAYDDAVTGLQAVGRATAEQEQRDRDAAEAVKLSGANQTEYNAVLDTTRSIFEQLRAAPPDLGRTFIQGIHDAISGLSLAAQQRAHFLEDLKYAADTSPTNQATRKVAQSAKDAEKAYLDATRARDAFLNVPSKEQTEAKLRLDLLDAEIARRKDLDDKKGEGIAKTDAVLAELQKERDQTSSYLSVLDTQQKFLASLDEEVRKGNISQETANALKQQYAGSSRDAAAAVATYTERVTTEKQAHDALADSVAKVADQIAGPLHGAHVTAQQDTDETRRTITDYDGEARAAAAHVIEAQQQQADAFVAAGGTIGTALGDVSTASATTSTDVQTDLAAIPPAAETSATGVGVAFSGLPDQLGGYAQAGTDELSKTGQGAIKPAGDTGKAIGDALGGSLLQTIQGWLGKLGDAVSSALDAARQQAAALAAGGAPGGYGPGGGSATQTQVESWLLGAGASPTEARTLSAIAMAESGGNAGISNLQGSGAQGLFQFMPGTAAGVGLANPNDPYAATLAALRLSRSSGGYGPWEAYTKGTYRAYMSATQGGSAPYGYATATGGPSPVGYLGMSVGPEPAPDSVLGFSQAGLDRLASLGITFGGQPGGTPWEQTRAGRIGTAIAGATAAGQAMAPAATGPMALAQALSAAQAQAQQQQAQAAEQAAQAALKAWQDAAAKFGNDSAEAAAAYEKYQTQQAQAAQKAAADALSSWVQSNHQRLQDEQNLSRDSQAIAKDNARVDQIAGTDRLAHHSAVTKGMLDDERRYTAGAQAFANQMAAAARAADLQVQADDTELSQTQDTNARAVLQVKRDADAAAAQSANQAATDAASDYRDAYGQMTSDAQTFAAQQAVLAKIGSDAQRAAFNQNVIDAAAAEAEIGRIQQESIGVTDAAWLESANRRIDYLRGVAAADKATNDEIVKNAQSAATAAQKAYNTVTGPPNVAAAAPAMSGSWSSATGIPASGAEFSGMLVRGPDGELRPLVWLTPGQGPGQYRPPNVAPGVQPGTEQPATATTPPTVTPAPPVPGVGQPVVITLHLDKHRVASILVPDISQLQGRSVELAGYGS